MLKSGKWSWWVFYGTEFIAILDALARGGWRVTTRQRVTRADDTKPCRATLDAAARTALTLWNKRKRRRFGTS